MHENSGMKVNREMVRFIQVGKTTRAEVVGQMGTKYVSLWHDSAMAYPFETKGVSFEWYEVAWLGFTGMSQKTDVETSPTGSRWQAFFVAFDDQAVVRAACFKKLITDNKSVDEQLDKWVASLPPTNSIACRP